MSMRRMKAIRTIAGDIIDARLRSIRDPRRLYKPKSRAGYKRLKRDARPASRHQRCVDEAALRQRDAAAVAEATRQQQFAERQAVRRVERNATTTV